MRKSTIETIPDADLRRVIGAARPPSADPVPAAGYPEQRSANHPFGSGWQQPLRDTMDAGLENAPLPSGGTELDWDQGNQWRWEFHPGIQEQMSPDETFEPGEGGFPTGSGVG
jgi:hypothetical protein